MISDWSGSYRIRLFKMLPSNFYRYFAKTNNTNWRKLDLPCFEDNVRNKIGYIVSEKNLSSINSIIKEIKPEIKKNWNDQIIKIREDNILMLEKLARMEQK